MFNAKCHESQLLRPLRSDVDRGKLLRLGRRVYRDLLLRASVVLAKENRGKAEAMRQSTTGFTTNTRTMPQICAWMSRPAMFHCLG
jgi:hypothetical protein